MKLPFLFNCALFVLMAGCNTTEPIQKIPLISKPAKSEVLLINDRVPIQWEMSGARSARIDFSSDSGVTWEMVELLYPEDPLWNNYSWQVPNVVPTSHQCFLKIVDTITSQTVVSDPFSVTGLIFESPVLGATIGRGTNYAIKWKTYKYTDAVILFSSDSGASYRDLLTKAMRNTDTLWQNFVWNVPDSVLDGCLIKIMRYQGPDEEFLSPVFEIR
jgi:hypothetical protein